MLHIKMEAMAYQRIAVWIVIVTSIDLLTEVQAQDVTSTVTQTSDPLTTDIADTVMPSATAEMSSQHPVSATVTLQDATTGAQASQTLGHQDTSISDSREQTSTSKPLTSDASSQGVAVTSASRVVDDVTTDSPSTQDTAQHATSIASEQQTMVSGSSMLDNTTVLSMSTEKSTSAASEIQSNDTVVDVTTVDTTTLSSGGVTHEDNVNISLASGTATPILSEVQSNETDVEGATMDPSTVFPDGISSEDNVNISLTTTIVSELDSNGTVAEGMTMDPSTMLPGRESNENNTESTVNSSIYLETMTTDVPNIDTTVQSTSNSTNETTMNSLNVTANESSLYTSEPDNSTVSTPAVTNVDNTSEPTNITLEDQNNATTQISSTYVYESDTTGSDATTSEYSISADIPKAPLTRIDYTFQFTGDCNRLLAANQKEVFINKFTALLAKLKQIDSQYITVNDIRCGSLFFNVTFDRISHADIEALLSELINLNTTIYVDDGNDTMEFQMEEYNFVSMVEVTTGASLSTETLESSMEVVEGTTETIVTSELEFLFEFTGDCTVLIKEETGDSETTVAGLPQTAGLTTHRGIMLSTEETNLDQTTPVASYTSTVAEDGENTTNKSDYSSVSETNPVTAEPNTMSVESVTSDISPTESTSESTDEENVTMGYTTENTTNKAGESLSTEDMMDSTSTEQNTEVNKVQMSTVSSQTDITSGESKSTSSENNLQASTDPMVTGHSEHDSLSARDQFEVNLSEKLSQIVNISENDIRLGPVSCGSVVINVTLLNQLNQEEVERQILNLPNKPEKFTIIVEDNRGQSHTYQLKDVSVNRAELSEQTTIRMFDDEDDGLTEIELIVIIICGVLGGTLLLALLAFLIYRCCSTRNRKSFVLGEPSAPMDLEDFTLTKMTRPSPVYTDHGVRYTNPPKQAQAHNNQIYHSNNGHFENNHNTHPVSSSGMRSSRENLVAESGGPHVSGGMENPSFASDDILDSGSNTSTELPYDGRVEMNAGRESSTLM